MLEIERKFAVRTLPDLTHIRPIRYERYFLDVSPEYEDRIQKKGDIYERERKVRKSDLSRSTEKEIISAEEFELLKKSAMKGIIRESYHISDFPRVSIKVYHGEFEGLVRAEVECCSEEEAIHFVPFAWMGEEITYSPLGKDAKLLGLSREEFQMLLEKLER